MKYLYLLRHAKSSRDIPELTDFERPLSHRGRTNAPVLGHFMKKKGIKLETIISSPANRALTTARFVAEALDYPLKDIVVKENIYEAWLEQLVDVVKEIPDAFQTAMIVGHNPGLHLLADYLAGFPYENLPTAGLIGIELHVRSWKETTQDKGKIILFQYPKKNDLAS